jgi:hypothetical protein
MASAVFVIKRLVQVILGGSVMSVSSGSAETVNISAKNAANVTKRVKMIARAKMIVITINKIYHKMSTAHFSS